MSGAGKIFLKLDAAHAAKIRQHEVRQAKLEGVLRLAKSGLTDGDAAERAQIVAQIDTVLGQASL